MRKLPPIHFVLNNFLDSWLKGVFVWHLEVCHNVTVVLLAPNHSLSQYCLACPENEYKSLTWVTIRISVRPPLLPLPTMKAYS